MTLCACGCRKEIVIKSHHKYYGIPKYIWGHHIKDNNPNKVGILSHNYGRKYTKERCIKISDALINKKKSDEHNSKNSQSHLGHIPWNKGKTNLYSIETLEKMSKSKRGKHLTEMTKKKLIGRLPSHGKRYYYDSTLQGIVCFRSTWELKYAQYLDEHKILWYYEIETFDLGDTTYTPDFYLIEQNKFIEIKGWMHERSKNKINKFLSQYSYNLEILKKDDLINLGIIL